jgi:hypothetical protein
VFGRKVVINALESLLAKSDVITSIRKAPVGSGAVYAIGPTVTWQARLAEPLRGLVIRLAREKKTRNH